MFWTRTTPPSGRANVTVRGPPATLQLHTSECGTHLPIVTDSQPAVRGSRCI